MIFIDTGAFLARYLPDDQHHKAAVALWGKIRAAEENSATSNFVLDETISLLFRRRPFEEVARFTRGLLTSPSIGIEEITPARFRKAFDLRLMFRDKPDISFTDLTTMIVAQDLKVTDILTGDKHFIQAGLGFRLLP